jgi:regulator of sigma E protease
MEILIAILVLSVLVLVHEFGHFIAAKRAGMLVEEFGLGLPPRLFGVRKGETIYSINALPFGGFVKIFGESGLEKEMPAHAIGRAFYEKPLWVRFITLVSGVLMNFLLGILLFSILFSVGVPVAVSDERREGIQNLHVEILQVANESPAAKAGLRVGDAISSLSFGSESIEVTDIDQIPDFTKKHRGEEITMTVQRGEEKLEFPLTPRLDPPPGEGALGISMAEVGILKYPWYRSVVEAFRISYELSGAILQALGGLLVKLFSTGKVEEGVAGPIGIVDIAGEAARLGWLRLLSFVALLTVNLAVLNILPLPALDGGRVALLFLEKILGKPLPRKFEMYTHSLGMALLLALILLISIQDIRRLF